jgi:hypothetical protein
MKKDMMICLYFKFILKGERDVADAVTLGR